MITNRTFRLFISSTFEDFKKERDLLQTKVFPVIENYCKDLGFIFQPVDLRWGITEEAQLDQKTMELCINEIKVCREFPKPNFLIMLGNRYGWIPLPYIIEKNEFEKILIFGQTSEKKTLLKWYKLDNNHIPASYFLAERTKKYEEYNNWYKEENLIRNIFQKLVIKTSLNKKIKDKYFTSATEQEAYYGIFFERGLSNSKKNLKNIFVYFKEESTDDSMRLTKLKKRIKNKTLKKYIFNNLSEEDFTNNIKNYLIAMINEHINYLKKFDDKSKEIYQHKIFKENLLEVFEGRIKEINLIQQYINSLTYEPLIIAGPSGVGKTSLIAKSISLNENKKIIYRFVGTSENSTNLRQLLISILDSLYESNIDIQYELDEKKFFKQIRTLFEQIKIDALIYIDAIDQLKDKKHILWLPEKLPNNLKFIISVLNDENYKNEKFYFEQLANRVKQTNIINLDAPADLFVQLAGEHPYSLN